MALHRGRLVGLAFLVTGCIPGASFELPTATGDDPFETDGPYDPTVSLPDSDVSSGVDSLGTDGGSGSSDADPSGPFDPSDVTSGPVDPSTSGPGSDTDAETGGTGGEASGESSTGTAIDPFSPAEPFGDQAAESGLVGTWTVAWNPDGTPHWSLEIAEDGGFVWTEAAASCNAQAAASGQLWIDGDALVFHVETWDKREPWPVQSVVGQPLVPPFRMRLDHVHALGMLSLSGPWELTALLGWEGRVYRRESGFGPAGVWHGRASLEAVLEGEDTARLIVEDVYSMETAAGAQAFERSQRTWYHGETPFPQPEVEELGSWFNMSPGELQGMIWVAGITHLFDEERLVSFDETRVFSEEAPAGCD